MPPSFERIADTREIIERLSAFHNETLDPRVVGFARFLANRLNVSLQPTGFVLSVRIALLDLQDGISGVDGEPFEHDLARLEPGAYVEIANGVPAIAEAVLPPKFAEQVKDLLVEAGLITPPEPAAPPEPLPGEVLSQGEIITQEIETMEDAQTLIIEDAKRRVMALDWERFGISEEEAGRIFDLTYPSIVRDSPYPLSFDVIDESITEEAGLLSVSLPHQKVWLQGNTWLAFVDTSIRPEDATFARDYLLVTVPEVIAKTKQLDHEVVIRHFLDGDTRSPVFRAGVRIHSTLQGHSSSTD